MLKNASTNQIYVTREFANKYDLTESAPGAPVGSLDDYLTANGAHQTEIMRTVPNYSDIQSVTPVNNIKVKEWEDVTVTDPDTYDITVGNLTAPTTTDHLPTATLDGSYSPAVQNGYSVTNTLPTMSVTPYTETGDMKTVVTGGTAATNSVDQVGESHNTVVNKTIYTLPANKTYNKFVSEEWNFTTAEVNSKLSDILPSLNYDDDGVIVENGIGTHYANNISFYYDESGFNNFLQDNTNSGSFIYNKNTTLKEFLEYFGNNSNGFVNYNGSTKLSSTTGTFHTISSDDAYIDKKFTEWFFNHQTINKSSETYTWSLDTNIQEYYNAIVNTTSGSDAGHITAKVYLKEDISGSSSLDTKYKGSQDPKTLTYRQYFDDLKANIPGFDYNVTSDGKLQLIMNGDYQIGFTNMSGTTTKIGETTNSYDIQVNTAAIAQNIYLGRCILAEKTPEEYNSGIGAVSAIETKLNSIYGSDLRALALVGKELEAAIQSNNNTTIQTVMTKIENMLSSNTKYTPSSTDYTDSTVTDPVTGNKTITNYNFTKVSSSSSLTPDTTEISAGTTTITKGEISNAPSDADIKEYFAKAMYDSNNSQSYENYLTKLNGLSLNSYELAILYNNKSNSGLISKLISCSNQSDIISWINNNLDAKFAEDKLNNTYYNLTNQSTSNNFSCTPKVNSPSRNDIIKYLANEMYNAYPEKSQTEWETYITNKFGSSNWNYSDLEVASISANYSANSSDILSKLKSGANLDSYKNSFNGYELNMSTTNNLSFGSVGTEEHYVTMDSVNDIAARLASDIYAVNSSVNPETVKNQIQSTFSAKQLASLSKFYGTSTWNSIVSALSSSINASAVNSWTHEYDSYSDIRPDSSNDFSISTVPHSHINHEKGQINIPTIDGIASNLVAAFRKAGKTVDPAEVRTKLAAIYNDDNDSNNQNLANINDAVCKYLNDSGNVSNIENIYNNLA